METLWPSCRRTLICRYCVIISFVVYVVVFVSLLSSSPRSLQDVGLDVRKDAAAVVRNYSTASTPPRIPLTVTKGTAWVVMDGGRRPLDVAVGAAEVPTTLKTTKKPTALEVLHKNMTLHKANMSDLLKHVKAAVASNSDVDNAFGARNGTVAHPHPFRYIINTVDVCRNHEIYIIAYIHTAPDHYKRRVVIRQTWGDASYYDIGLRVVFVMGRGANTSHDVQKALEFEAAQYNDIVQEDFLDTYRNLTYKGVAALRWISRYCAHARYVLKTDDDIFVNSFNLLRHLRRIDRLAAANATAAANRQPGAPTVSPAPRGMLLCLVWYTMMVMREGKWKVSKEEWPDASYPTYCSGSAFLMTTDVALAMHRISYDVPFFWVDDFYITGLLPLKLGPRVVTHTQFISAYVLNGNQLEEKFTGPQWYQYVFSHVHNLNIIQSVWKTVVRLARGEIRPTIAFALPGNLPKVTVAPAKEKSKSKTSR